MGLLSCVAAYLRALWRARAFLFEQFREQYFDRGRACFEHSCQAQTPPRPSAAGAVFRAAAFFTAPARAAEADFAGLFFDADESGDEELAGGGGASVAVRLAAFRARIIFGLAGRLAFVFDVLTGLFTAPPFTGLGWSAIGGRLLVHSQQRSMVAGST